jgi:Rod binding domain-containing protein
MTSGASIPVSMSEVTGQAGLGKKNVQQAARDFEALLIGQVLKAARQSSNGGWLGEGDDQAGSTMLEVAEEHLARALAASGGLGLGKMILRQLGQSATQAPQTPTSSAGGDASVVLRK